MRYVQGSGSLCGVLQRRCPKTRELIIICMRKIDLELEEKVWGKTLNQFAIL